MEAPGFKSAIVPDAELQLGQIARVDVELTVGQVADSVTVTSEALMVWSETVSLGEVMDNGMDVTREFPRQNLRMQVIPSKL